MNVENAISEDGILKMRFDLPHNKRYSPKKIEYPTPYVDVRLEPDYSRKYAFECDLTFWAVQFLRLRKGACRQWHINSPVFASSQNVRRLHAFYGAAFGVKVGGDETQGGANNVIVSLNVDDVDAEYQRLLPGGGNAQ